MTSDGPSGNIGCPITEEECAHFIKMIEKTIQHTPKVGWRKSRKLWMSTLRRDAEALPTSSRGGKVCSYLGISARPVRHEFVELEHVTPPVRPPE